MVMFALEGVESRRQEDAPSLKSFRLGQASKGHKVLTTVKGYSYKMEQQQKYLFCKPANKLHRNKRVDIIL